MNIRCMITTFNYFLSKVSVTNLIGYFQTLQNLYESIIKKFIYFTDRQF